MVDLNRRLSLNDGGSYNAACFDIIYSSHWFNKAFAIPYPTSCRAVAEVADAKTFWPSICESSDIRFAGWPNV